MLARLLGLVLVATIATFSYAADWIPLKRDSDIREILTDKLVVYAGEKSITQTFNSDGSTVYTDDRPSYGKWKVSGGQYCSQWPPSESWACFDIFAGFDNDKVRFVSDRGQEWIARIAD